MTQTSKQFEISEYFRFLTPLLITIAMFMINTIEHKVDRIDEKVEVLDAKIFKHLTNDELHAPRTLILSKPEFEIYQQMRNKQMDGVGQVLIEIKQMIREHIRETK